MPVTNAASAITLANSGPQGDLENISGAIVSSFNGQTIDARNATGPLLLNHNDLTIIDVSAKGCWELKPLVGTRFKRCDFGSPTGVDDDYGHPLEDDLGAACFRVGEFESDHMALYGFIDLFHPEGGEILMHHTLFGPMYHDHESRHQGGGDAHNDAIQPRPSYRGLSRMVIDLVKFESWPFHTGMTWDAVGDMSHGAATGVWNLRGKGCKNVTINRFHLDGNWAQNYVQVGAESEPEFREGTPTNIAFVNGVIVKRRPLYGVHRILNLGAAGGASGTTTATWLNVRDHQSGAQIDPRDFGGVGGGTVIMSGDPDSFPTYDGWGDEPPPPPPPPPPGEVWVPRTERDSMANAIVDGQFVTNEAKLRLAAIREDLASRAIIPA